MCQASGAILSCIDTLKNTTKERAEVTIEAPKLYSSLMTLGHRAVEASSNVPQSTAVRTLGVENGALDQLKSDLKQLASKITLEDAKAKEIGRISLGILVNRRLII